MDILCIFVSAEKLNFILNPFTLLLMSRISLESLKFCVSQLSASDRIKVRVWKIIVCMTE